MNIPRSLVTKHTFLDSSYIPLPFRRKVLTRDKGHCHFCHESTSYLCHNLVKCRGGKTIPDNLLTCCVPCRRDKGELTAAEYLAVRLKEEDIFQEAKAMLIEIHFVSGEPLTGEVPYEPSMRSPEFYVQVGNNGKTAKVNTANVTYFFIVGAKEKGG